MTNVTKFLMFFVAVATFTLIAVQTANAQCEPPLASPSGNPCDVEKGIKTKIAAPAPYQQCILEVTYDYTNCDGIFSISNAEFDFTPGCDKLEKDLEVLSSDPHRRSY